MVMSRKACLLSILLVVFFAVAVSAEDDKPVLMESIRCMSMGGAYAGVADDENLLFFNPAGLVNIEHSRLTTMNLNASFNLDAIRFLSETISSYGETKDFRKFSPGSIHKLQDMGTLFSITPARIVYIRPGFALAFLNVETNAKSKSNWVQGQSDVRFSSDSDGAIALGIGSHIYKGISGGIVVKYISRFRMSDIPGNSLRDREPVVLIGRGAGLDVGLLWNDEPWRLGFSVRDAFGTKLSWQEGVVGGDWQRLEKRFTTTIDEDVTFGVSYRPGWKLTRYPYIPEDLILALDVGALNPLARNLHLGMEARIFRWLMLRMGINTGLRVGIGLRTTMWNIDLMYATRLRDEYLDRDTDNNFSFSIALSY